MRIKNPSAVEVRYDWAFYNHDPFDDIKVTLEALKKSLGKKVPLNEIFDILPIRATLDPGEQELVEVSYYAFPGYAVKATAVCRVQTPLITNQAHKCNCFFNLLTSNPHLSKLHSLCCSTVFPRHGLKFITTSSIVTIFS